MKQEHDTAARWRLVLGRYSDRALNQVQLDAEQLRLERTLDYLYNREYDGRGQDAACDGFGQGAAHVVRIKPGDDAGLDMLDEVLVHGKKRRAGHGDVLDPKGGHSVHGHVDHMVAVAQVVVERQRHAVGKAALAQGIGNGWVFDAAKMHGDMAAPGVIAKDARRQVPGRIAVTREIGAVAARPQRDRHEYGKRLTRPAVMGRQGCGSHARASGGR